MPRTRNAKAGRVTRQTKTNKQKDPGPTTPKTKAGVKPKPRARRARRPALPKVHVNGTAAKPPRSGAVVTKNPFLSATRSLSAASLSLSAACLSMSSACLSLSGPFDSPAPRSPAPTHQPKPKAKLPRVSQHFLHPFPDPEHKQRAHFLSTLPFPPLSHERFGLMQERLAHDPFRLLLATIFLNKTQGERAMPIFHVLMEAYPTPKDLAHANAEDVTKIIRTLGFQNQRAKKCLEFAQAWVSQPPERGKRYRKLNYPEKGHGKNIKTGETLDDKDERVAWEISHLPGLGPYSHDSWRMFCRDELRGLASDWLGSKSQPVQNGEGRQFKFEPEWKRVLPEDKELRAWMTWMWLKEGLLWNKETGEKKKAGVALMRMAHGGGVVQDNPDDVSLTIKARLDDGAPNEASVERPAGDFMPG